MHFKGYFDITRFKPFVGVIPVVLENLHLTLEGNILTIIATDNTNAMKSQFEVEGYEDGSCLLHYDTYKRLKIRSEVDFKVGENITIQKGATTLTLPLSLEKFPKISKFEVEWITPDPILFTDAIQKASKIISTVEGENNDLVFVDDVLSVETIGGLPARALVFPNQKMTHFALPAKILSQIKFGTEEIKIGLGEHKVCIVEGNNVYIIDNRPVPNFNYQGLFEETGIKITVKKTEFLDALEQCRVVGEQVALILDGTLKLRAKGELGAVDAEICVVEGEYRNIFETNHLIDAVKRFGDEVEFLLTDNFIRFEKDFNLFIVNC